MPRHRTIWDAELQKEITVQFTSEEEAERDTAEAAALLVAFPVYVTYEQFESRLTPVELDGMTDFLYAKDLSGSLVRPRMVQAFNRALSRNSIDLTSPATDAFLQEFVVAGILTALRKDELLAG
jgi:hypothetical protein